MPFGMEKLEWCGYPMVKKNFEDTFIHFDRMYERDRRTDAQTPHDGIGLNMLRDSLSLSRSFLRWRKP